MTILETLIAFTEPWSVWYSESTALSAGLTYAHLGAMMIGGGLAIAADRQVLRSVVPVTAEARIALATILRNVHRPVLLALSISAVSGALQLAADIESLAANSVMWVKTGLLLALAANGVLMLRNEAGLRLEVGAASSFRALRVRAVTSVVLWLAIVLAGVGLMQG